MNILKKITNNKIRILILIFAFVAVPFFSGCGNKTTGSYNVSLELWTVYDSTEYFSDIIAEYKKINPHITNINIRKFSQDTYKQELIDALATGIGPDMYVINNSWLPSFKNKLSPAPATFVSEQIMKSDFPDVVAQDFVSEGKVYAVPLSVDTMALYYNKDMFNNKIITSPPKTWDEFQEDVKIFTEIDVNGNILHSGAAIGTAKNVKSSTDLFSLFMFQYGVKMPTEKDKIAKFDQSLKDPQEGKVIETGQEALNFYTKFARITNDDNSVNPFYTWNIKQHDSVDAFAEGATAMTFGYSWLDAQIKSKNPKLNYAIAPVPQKDPNNQSTIANYWGYTVSSTKPADSVIQKNLRLHESWQFIRFLTLKKSGSTTLYNALTKNPATFPVSVDPALIYLKKTNQPAARRDLIDIQKSDPFLGTFSASSLIAKNWYKGDSEAVDKIISDMIETVVNNSGGSRNSMLNSASAKINQLIRK